jgi:peptide/nickel transport system ATP-binding protein/peptide/nickel transport system permease protein
VDEIRDMPFAAPNAGAIAGTDYLGADVLSRVLSGGQQILMLACLSVLLAWLFGGGLGMIAAVYGRWIDRLLLAGADILLSVPGLLLLTLVVTVSGRGYLAAVVAAILVMLPDIFRLVRAATLQQLQQDYVEFARCRGETPMAIFCREIAPNLLPLIGADVGIRLLSAIFILATASFLGLGAEQPLADWGLMIMENRQGLTFQPWATLAPVIAILLVLIPLNLSLDSVFHPVRRGKLRRHFPSTRAESIGPEILEIHQVTLKLKDQVLLRNVNLKLMHGEIVALVGPSGSGKSTLLRAALGQVSDDVETLSGEVCLAGKAMSLLSAKSLRSLRAKMVGFVPQDPRLSMLPSQTLAAYFRIMGDNRGLSAEQRDHHIQIHFRQLGLPDDPVFLHRYPHEISGGQRQRVMVVAAIMGYPKLLLMDEPTSALDAISTQTVMQWISATARKEGMTVLFVAHDLPQACQIADTIAVMSEGELAERQATADFLCAPESHVGQALLQACCQVKPAPAICQISVPILKCEQLRAWHGTRVALEPMDLTLGRGETLTIAGPSGGGKTTLLRTLVGLHSKASGTLQLQGNSLPLKTRARNFAQKRELQYVAQNPASSLNPVFKVYSLLERPLRLCCPELNAEQRNERIYEVMQQVGLSEQILLCRPPTLSGGQQQRVALARALITRPDILLCDEVTSAVDGAVKTDLLRLLHRLQHQQGIALLIVTHDLMLPAYLGGALMVIDKGQVVEHGCAAKILAHPLHPITRQLVEASQLKTGIAL